MNRENGTKTPDSAIKRALRKYAVRVAAPAILLLGAVGCGPTFNTPLPVDCNTQAGRQLVDCATPTPAAATGTPRPTETPTIIFGPKGEPGQNGESAYQIWLNAGNKGSVNDYLNSLRGPQGQTGLQGPKGEGVTGPAGKDGANGINGTNGKDGKDGKDGAQGPAGPKGDKGDKGDLVTVVATTTPAPTPTRTPEPTATPILAPFIRIPLKPGESINVGPNDVVEGDVRFNGIPWYDDISTSGLGTDVREDAIVTADFGATVLRVPSGQSKAPAITVAGNELDQTGCGNQQTGCVTVDQVQFPGTSQRVLHPPVATTVAPVPRQIGDPIPDMIRNEIRNITPFTIISGDIKVNGRELFDNEQRTGLIVEFEQGAVVESPYGASGKTNLENTPTMEVAADEMARGTFAAHPEIQTISVYALRNGQVQLLRVIGR